jgi:hypothetical protein
MSEIFIVRVIKKTKTITTPPNGVEGKPLIEEEVSQIYEQEFDKLNIGEFAVSLNRNDGKIQDRESIKA